MNSPLCNYMKVGLVHFMAFPETMKGEGPILETINKVAVDDYFAATEITTIKNLDVRRQVKNLLESSHMTVAYAVQTRLLTTNLNLNDTNEEGRQQALANVKEGSDEAYEIGADMAAYGDAHPRFGVPQRRKRRSGGNPLPKSATGHRLSEYRKPTHR